MRQTLGHFPEAMVFLQVQEVGWHDVAGWLGRGGSMLGTKRSVAPGQCTAYAWDKWRL